MLSRDATMAGAATRRDPYSAEQWAEICSAIQKIKPGEVPAELRDRITDAIRHYRNWSDRHKRWERGPGRVNSENDMAAWRAVAKALRKLQSALSAIKNPGQLLHGSSEPLMILYCFPAIYGLLEKGDDEAVHKLLQWNFDAQDFEPWKVLREHLLRNWIVPELIEQLVRQADYHSKPHWLGGDRFKRIRREDMFRIYFYRDLFEIWTDIGGILRPSRHPKTGELRGPLIGFLRAVTKPVMGAEAPSLECLADAIKREKRLRTKCNAIWPDRFWKVSELVAWERACARKSATPDQHVVA